MASLTAWPYVRRISVSIPGPWDSVVTLILLQHLDQLRCFFPKLDRNNHITWPVFVYQILFSLRFLSNLGKIFPQKIVLGPANNKTYR